MTFTRADAEALQAAREKVTKLEKQEREALTALAEVLQQATSDGWSLDDTRRLARFADSLRDTLLPFDSGVRLAKAVPEAPSHAAMPVGPWVPPMPSVPDASRIPPWARA